jgi:hypothetical protein
MMMMMIQALSKGVNQKPAAIKGVAPAMPSRAFALWLALLFLYFLLLPSAAETPRHEAAFTARTGEKRNQTLSADPGYRLAAPVRTSAPFSLD